MYKMRSKLTFATLAVMCLGLAVVAMVVEFAFRDAMEVLNEALKTKAMAYTAKLADEQRFAMVTGSYDELGKAFEKFVKEQQNSQGVLMRGVDGKVIAETGKVELPSNIIAALTSNQAVAVSRDNIIYSAAPVSAEGQVHGHIYIVAKYTQASDLRDQARLIYGPTYFFVLLLLFSAVHLIGRGLVTPLEKMVSVARNVAAGDLSQPSLPERGSHEVVQLSVAINQMLENLRAQMQQIGKTVNSLSSASSEILAVAQQTEANATDEASAVEETRRTMEGMLEAANEIAEGAEVVVMTAEQSLHASGEVGQKIMQLNAQAMKITDISESIQSIADKSDILALNASLEGTKAGEAGRGFVLVGTEMRRLAETTKDAANQIKQLASEMRLDSQSAVMASEQMQKIANETTETAKRITLITNQQRTATEQVTMSMNELQEASRQALDGARQSKETANDLVQSAGELTVLLRSSQMVNTSEG